jgi:putative ABC transport system ATP-binding protein
MNNSEKIVIELNNITKSYGSKNTLVVAIKELNYVVREKEFIAIMGQSGSGKTTLLHVLGCLHRPTGGDYILEGIKVSTLKGDDLARIRNQKIGFIFQKFNLLNGYNIIKNVELPLQYMSINKSEREDRAVEMLKKVGLGDRLHHKPSELSGGQAQRVAIARALVTNPAIILGDEMTGNLDSKTSEEIMEFMKQLNAEGRTILFVTHTPEIGAYAQKIIEMRDGLILKEVLNT